MDDRRKEILVVVIFLIVQTIVYIVGCTQKSYIHMDEAYSLGLASYNKTEIQDNEDFYDNWHTKDYYEDYIAVNENEIGKYSQVYLNQKNDVHPPLYYLILRFAMGFSVGHYSKWPGVIVNIIIYVFITLTMYLILQKILKKEKNVKEKSIILAFISSLTMASLSNVLYIRMYSLATLNILVITYLHMKLIESKEFNFKQRILYRIISFNRSSYTLLFYIFSRCIVFNIFC